MTDEQILAAIAASHGDLQSKIDANSAEIDAVKQLTQMLGPEVTALGQDVAQLKQDVKATPSMLDP